MLMTINCDNKVSEVIRLIFYFQSSYIPFFHTRQASSAGDIEAMESLRDILDNAHFINGSCFSYGFKYLNNETNKVRTGFFYCSDFEHLVFTADCLFV